MSSLAPKNFPFLLVLAIACSRPPDSNKEARPRSEEEELTPSPKEPTPALASAQKTSDKPPDVVAPSSSDSAIPPVPSRRNDQRSVPPTSEASPQSQQECEKTCNGVYQKWGRAQRLGCNCRTKDHDRECRDGNECEGTCLAENGKKTVTDPGPPEKGYFLGRCSELRHTYGCNQVLPRGITKAGPYPLDHDPPTLCVD